MKKMFYILFLMPIILVSCESVFESSGSDEDLNVLLNSRELKVIEVDSVTVLNEKGCVAFHDSSLIEQKSKNLGLRFDTFEEDFQKIAPRNIEVGGPYTLVGYSSKELISTGSLMFSSQPDDPRLQPFTYYLGYKYHYKYRITIPHGASLVLPTEFTSDSRTGNKPSNENLVGYDQYKISESAEGDVYDLVTVIQDISYNISGQYLGFTSYIPFRVGNPSTDIIFKYHWIKTDWGDL